MGLTYGEIADILNIKNNAGSTGGYTIPVGMSEISDIKLILQSLLPDEVKLNLTVDDISLGSISNNKIY